MLLKTFESMKKQEGCKIDGNVKKCLKSFKLIARNRFYNSF